MRDWYKSVIASDLYVEYNAIGLGEGIPRLKERDLRLELRQTPSNRLAGAGDYRGRFRELTRDATLRSRSRIDV